MCRIGEEGRFILTRLATEEGENDFVLSPSLPSLKRDCVCIHLFNIYNGKVPRHSFWLPWSNHSEVGAPQKHMGRW